MDRQDTLGESVLISFMVVRVHLSLIIKLLGQVFVLSSLVVFEVRVLRLIRGVHLQVELNLLWVEERVVVVVDH